MPEVDATPEAPPVPEETELDRVLMAYGAAGHGQLYCSCGYLIWSCPCRKDCNFTPRIIETDHSRCIKKPQK